MRDVQCVRVLHERDVPRKHARARIRLALREMVADALGLDVERVTVGSVAGSTPRLLLDGEPCTAGISIAHDGRLSVAAFHAHGPVGVDVMQVQETPDWLDVARDYLGPQALATLMATPPDERARAFAQAWTRREASLKCLGLALSEWTELAEDFRFQALAVEAGYVVMAAVRIEPGTV